MKETNIQWKPRWDALLASLGVAPANEVFQEIVKAYTGTARHYHNLDHLAHMLETADSLTALAEDFNAIQLAIWFHDFVYESRNKDNEEHSAERAEEVMSAWNLPDAFRAKVTRMILATQSHQATDVDTHILLDADLAILGQAPDRYQAYARAIRQEYAWVSDNDYCSGRTQVLKHFLERTRIYHTQPMHALETTARQNLQAELDALSTSPNLPGLAK